MFSFLAFLLCLSTLFRGGGGGGGEEGLSVISQRCEPSSHLMQKSRFSSKCPIFLQLGVAFKIIAKEKVLKNFTAWKYDVTQDETALE